MLPCSLVYFISSLSANTSATVLSCDSEVINVRWKRMGHGWEKGNKKERRNGKSINLLGQHVTEFFY